MCRRGSDRFSKWFGLLILFVPFLCYSGEVITLKEALILLEENSFTSKVGEINKEKASVDVKEALSYYYPSLEFNIGHMNLDNDPAFKFGYLIFPAGDQVFWKWDLTLKYNIYDFGRRKELLNSRKKFEESISFKVKTDIKLKQIEVVSLYLNSLSLKRQVEVFEKREKAIEEHKKVAEELYDKGVVTRNEVLRSEVALRNVQDGLRNLKNKEMDLLEKLKKTIGMDLKKEIEIVDLGENLEKLENLLYFVSMIKEERAIEEALNCNEAIKAMREKEEALKRVLALSTKSFYPNLFLIGGHSYEQNRYMAYPHVNKIYFGLSFEIFDGGRRKSEVEKARLELEKVKLEKKDLEEEIKLNIMSAYRDYLNSLEEYKTAKLNVESSQENLKIVENQYREGILKTTDYLEAEAIYSESLFKEIDSFYKILINEAKILVLMGKDLKNLQEEYYGGL